MAVAEPPEFARTREMFDAWNEGDISRMPEFWTEDGDWIWEDPPEFPGGRNVRGAKAVQAHLAESIALIGRGSLRAGELSMVGDEVLAEVNFEVTGGQSGVHLQTTPYWLILYENGRVRRFRCFMNRDDAIAAAAGS